MSWLFARQLRPFVLAAALASLVLNLAMLVPAIYMVQVFDRVFASRSIETLAMLTLIAGIALALAYTMDALRARALAWAGATLQRRLAPPALEQSLGRAAGAAGAVGSAGAEALKDISQLRGFVSGHAIHALFDAPWLPVYLAVIAWMHPALGWTAFAGGALLMLIGVAAERLTRQPAADSRTHARAAARGADALIRNAEVIVGMGMSGAAVGRWRDVQDKLLQSQAELTGRSAHLGALARVARQVVQMAMLATGAWLVIEAGASPGIMVATTLLLGRALQPVEQLIASWKVHLDARDAWQRLAGNGSAGGPRRAVAPGAAPARLGANAANPLMLPAPTGRLDVERLVFGHTATRPPLLKGIDFQLEAGESLGIVGPSAAGKTTLVRLLLGLWRAQAGCVRLDGADIAQWDRDALGAHVGYLPQNVELLGGTIAENIARLAAVDETKVVEAARLAHAHDMILRLPDGYDTQIGEAGALLSGGQRQRVALARALYGAPTFVVLDEPNANLDAEGDDALRRTLVLLRERRTTVIVVGHRPALMAQLDKLAVLKDGTLAAFGPSASLLSRRTQSVPQAAPPSTPESALRAAPGTPEPRHLRAVGAPS